jgi:hypothetical protein
MKYLMILLIAVSSVHAADPPKKVCKIVNVRPMTKEELEKLGTAQVNYGTQYVQKLVCEVVEK